MADAQIYECMGCGRVTRNPDVDLQTIRRAGAVSCCPERKMAPYKPKVKPLLWLGGGVRYHTQDGEFAIEKLDDHRRVVWRLLQASLGTQYVRDFGGENALDEAKNVAQTIKSRSIINAIE